MSNDPRNLTEQARLLYDKLSTMTVPPHGISLQMWMELAILQSKKHALETENNIDRVICEEMQKYHDNIYLREPGAQ